MGKEKTVFTGTGFKKIKPAIAKKKKEKKSIAVVVSDSDSSDEENEQTKEEKMKRLALIEKKQKRAKKFEQNELGEQDQFDFYVPKLKLKPRQLTSEDLKESEKKLTEKQKKYKNVGNFASRQSTQEFFNNWFERKFKTPRIIISKGVTQWEDEPINSFTKFKLALKKMDRLDFNSDFNGLLKTAVMPDLLRELVPEDTFEILSKGQNKINWTAKSISKFLDYPPLIQIGGTITFKDSNNPEVQEWFQQVSRAGKSRTGISPQLSRAGSKEGSPVKESQPQVSFDVSKLDEKLLSGAKPKIKKSKEPKPVQTAKEIVEAEKLKLQKEIEEKQKQDEIAAQKVIDARKAEQEKELRETKKTAYEESFKKTITTTPEIEKTKKVKLKKYIDKYKENNNPTITQLINFLSLFAENEINIWNDKPKEKFTWNEAIGWFEKFFYNMRQQVPGTEKAFDQLTVFNPRGLIILGQALKLTTSRNVRHIYLTLIKLMTSDVDEEIREKAQHTLMKLYTYAIANFWHTHKLELPNDVQNQRILTEITNDINKINTSDELIKYLYQTTNQSKEKSLWRPWVPIISSNRQQTNDIYIVKIPGSQDEKMNKYWLTNERGNLLKMCTDIDDWMYPNVNSRNSLVAMCRENPDKPIDITYLIQEFKRKPLNQFFNNNVLNFTRYLYTLNYLEQKQKINIKAQKVDDTGSLTTGTSATKGSFASAGSSYLQKEMAKLMDIDVKITNEDEQKADKMLTEIYKQFEKGYEATYDLPERSIQKILSSPLREKYMQKYSYDEAISSKEDLKLFKSNIEAEQVDTEDEDEDDENDYDSVQPSYQSRMTSAPKKSQQNTTRVSPSSPSPGKSPMSPMVSKQSISEIATPVQTEKIKTSTKLNDYLDAMFALYRFDRTIPNKIKGKIDNLEIFHKNMLDGNFDEDSAFVVISMWNNIIDGLIEENKKEGYDILFDIWFIKKDRINILLQNKELTQQLYIILVHIANIPNDLVQTAKYLFTEYGRYIRTNFPEIFYDYQSIEKEYNKFLYNESGMKINFSFEVESDEYKISQGNEMGEQAEENIQPIINFNYIFKETEELMLLPFENTKENEDIINEIRSIYSGTTGEDFYFKLTQFGENWGKKYLYVDISFTQQLVWHIWEMCVEHFVPYFLRNCYKVVTGNEQNPYMYLTLSRCKELMKLCYNSFQSSQNYETQSNYFLLNSLELTNFSKTSTTSNSIFRSVVSNRKKIINYLIQNDIEVDPAQLTEPSEPSFQAGQNVNVNEPGIVLWLDEQRTRYILITA